MDKSRLVKYHHSRIEIHTVFIYSILFIPLFFGTFFFFIWLLLGIAQLHWKIVQIQGVNISLPDCPCLEALMHVLAGFDASRWSLIWRILRVIPSKRKTFILVNEHGWLDFLLRVEQGVLSSLLCWFIVTIYYLFRGTYSFTGSYEAFIYCFFFLGGGIGWLVMILGSLGHVLLWIRRRVWKVDAAFLYHGVLVADCLIG